MGIEKRDQQLTDNDRYEEGEYLVLIRCKLDDGELVPRTTELSYLGLCVAVGHVGVEDITVSVIEIEKMMQKPNPEDLAAVKSLQAVAETPQDPATSNPATETAAPLGQDAITDTSQVA
jgi:hypothetical protein